jgi:hypothetical protein
MIIDKFAMNLLVVSVSSVVNLLIKRIYAII